MVLGGIVTFVDFDKHKETTMKDSVRNTNDPIDLLSRREAARLLGVSVSTLAGWKCNGRVSIPCVKIGRLVKYRRADLEAFISERVVNGGVQ